MNTWTSKQPGTCVLKSATSARLLLLLGLAVGAGFGASVKAQSYAIDWYTIAGGGGTSTGGLYAVSGTIGQADAGHLVGGNYTIDGGFWGMIAAVQTPGAPLLTVSLTSTKTVIVSWSDPSTGFGLQQNSILGATNWLSVTNVPISAGGQKQVIVAPPIGNRYYRLKSP